jgi:DEAD/DEAH box helicase domain-containing protein
LQRCAARGEGFTCYKPPVVDPQPGIRRSSVNESRRVAPEFIERDLKTLVFVNSLATDLLVTYFEG